MVKYKQITVDIPKGYNYDSISTVQKNNVKLYFKCDSIDYNDVCDKLKIKHTSNITTDNSTMYNNELNLLLKYQAITKLFNIAEYYNRDKEHKEKDKYYYIGKFNVKHDNYYDEHNDYNVIQVYSPVPYFPVFIDCDDAQDVIDNPNFKEILDNIFKQ